MHKEEVNYKTLNYKGSQIHLYVFGFFLSRVASLTNNRLGAIITEDELDKNPILLKLSSQVSKKTQPQSCLYRVRLFSTFRRWFTARAVNWLFFLFIHIHHTFGISSNYQIGHTVLLVVLIPLHSFISVRIGSTIGWLNLISGSLSFSLSEMQTFSITFHRASYWSWSRLLQRFFRSFVSYSIINNRSQSPLPPLSHFTHSTHLCSLFHSPIYLF